MRSVCPVAVPSGGCDLVSVWRLRGNQQKTYEGQSLPGWELSRAAGDSGELRGGLENPGVGYL